MRTWQRDLDRGVDNELTRRIHQQSTERAGAPLFSIAQFVTEALDGAVADLDLPERYTFADWNEAKTEGLTAAQMRVFTQLKTVLISRLARPLSRIEHFRVGLALVMEWNRRAQLTSASCHTSDGRYFDNESDRRSHQTLLNERAARHAERVHARLETGSVA